MVDKITNHKNQEVEVESYFKDGNEYMQAMRLQNALQEQSGYLVPITILTAIIRDVAQQKFYTVPVDDYIPVSIGTEAAWAEDILMFRSFYSGGDFEKGYIETATEGRLASTSATLDAIRVKARRWAKEITYSIADVELAARTGVWNYITEQEKSRRVNWDLGIQKTAFLGSKDGTLEGLLTLSDVNIDTTLIPAPLATMTDEQFQAFAQGLLGRYQNNNNFTAMPNRLYIPLTDFTALGASTSVTFPILSKFDYLQNTFRNVTMQPDFKILPLAYSQVAQSEGKLTKNRYVLMRYDTDVARFEIPVDYTVTVPNSWDGWTIRNVGYGQHSGVLAARPQEILYLDAQS